MKKFRLALVVGVAILTTAATGCSSGSSNSPAASADTFSPFPTLTAPTTSAAPAYPNDHLTSFGATADAFAANHEADTRFVPGCCFGPSVTVADGGSPSTWNLAANLGPLVTNLTRNFPAHTNETVALSLLLNSDLPGDVLRVKVASQGHCKVFVYSSETLKKSAPIAELGPVVSINLYPPPRPVDARYSTDDVEQAIVTPGDGTQTGC